MSDINQKNVMNLLKESPVRVQSAVAGMVNAAKSIKWKTVAFIIPKNPEPSHRPRISGYRFYVPGAAKNQAFFNKYVLPELKQLFITTPCKMNIDLYVQTPKSFTQAQRILAEMRILRPWGNVGDVDNFAKTVMDCIQPNEKRGHVGILADDSLVIDGYTRKYYSITPRTEVSISYMGKIPEQLKKILRIRDF